MELANEAGVKIETINFIKLPPGLHGLKALQLALLGKANYSATTSLVSITSETCGTDLLQRLNDTISPKSGDTIKQAKNKYTTHKSASTTTRTSWPGGLHSFSSRPPRSVRVGVVHMCACGCSCVSVSSCMCVCVCCIENTFYVI